MSKKSRSKLWFLVHSWLALPIWFFVLIVCFTGTLAVVSQELVWLAKPEIRAAKPSDDAPLLTYDQVLKALREARPDLDVQYIMRPDESHFALQVQVVQPDNTTQNLYVNPYTGKIQGISRPSTSASSPAPCMAGGWCLSATATRGGGTWSRCWACRCSPRWSPAWLSTSASGKAF